MGRRLQLRAHLKLHIVDEARALLIGEAEQFLLTGRRTIRTLQLLDGTRPTADIVEMLQTAQPPPETWMVLERLLARGYIIDVPEVSAPIAAMWHANRADPFSAAPIALHTEYPGLRQALRNLGVPLDADAPIRLVVTDDYLDPSLEALNRRALQEGWRWILARPAGRAAWIGPAMHPDGPCWACLAHRLRLNQPVRRFTGVAANPARGVDGVSFIAAHIARWMADPTVLQSRLHTLDLWNFTLQTHPVVRRPQCPACGDPDTLRAQVEAPILLSPRPFQPQAEGGLRQLAAQDAWQTLRRLVDPLTGVVQSVRPMARDAPPMRRVFGAAFAPPWPIHDVSEIVWLQMSGGKGRTEAQARLSALGEAIERHSGGAHGDEPRTRALLKDLGEDAISPAALVFFSDAQRQAPPPDPNRPIPPLFDPDVAIDWTPVWSMTHQRRRYLPTEHLYLRAPDRRFCPASSNGHAAGTGIEEAILQGLLELVERDAVAIWWYNRLRRPALPINDLGDGWAIALVDHYRAEGWALSLLDLTHDLGIPVVAAVAQPLSGTGLSVGFGAHLRRDLAAQRALTECNQMFDPSRPAPWDAAAGDAFLSPSADAPLAEDLAAGDLREAVNVTVDRLAAAGIEVLVCDQTRPDVGVSVAKVVAPGLRHVWPQFGPGRLYDVPVTMGWRAAPLAEDALNSVPLLI
ncbi:MAG: TOMM precursor leader peptide-binding protein [Myxococcota bacterium]